MFPSMRPPRFLIGNGPARPWPVMLIAMVLTSCASTRTVDLGQAMRSPPPPGVSHGSLVHVSTLDGHEARFRVTEMTDEGLGGEAGFFAYRQMERLEVEVPRDGGRASAWILGALGVLGVIALIDNADSVSVCSQPPCPQP